MYLQIDQIVRLRMPGGAQYLANRLNISRSTFFRCLEEMKALGAPIAFDEHRRCYYYKEQGTFAFGYIRKSDLSAIELVHIKGGFGINGLHYLNDRRPYA